jgi:hypothetical protein
LEGVVGRRGEVVGERLDPGLDGATVGGEPAIGAERRVLPAAWEGWTWDGHRLMITVCDYS